MIKLDFLTTFKKKIKLISQIIGTKDISKIGDGTITGALNALLKKSAVINTNTVTEAGFALDARQANPNVAGSLGAQIATLNTNLGTLSGKLEFNPNVSKIICSVDYHAGQTPVMTLRFVDNLGNHFSLSANENILEYAMYQKETDTWKSVWVK